MERIKHFYASAVAAVIALILVIVGILAVTVFKPAQEQSSSVVPATDIVMTRDGVLPLLGDKVQVSASSASGADVVVILGTSSDVAGWVGADAHTEVIGIESDREKLKVEEREEVTAQSGARAQSGDISQSGDASQSGSDNQSGAQSSSQSGEQTQSGEQAQSGSASKTDPQALALLEQIEKSDMWLDQASGQGTASLSIAQIPTGRSVMAVSAAGSDDLTLTLTWKVHRANTLAIVSFLFAAIFLLAAGVLFLPKWKSMRDREKRAQRVAQRQGADITDTTSINTAEVAAMAEKERLDKLGETSPDVLGVDAVSSHDHLSVVDDESKDQSEDFEHSIQSDAQLQVDSGFDEDDVNVLGDAQPDHEAEQDVEGEQADESDPAPVLLVEQAEPVVRGRHGSTDGPIDEDPPEKVPTDTGIIDLSAIRPGAVLPSRRALREAREKGEHKIVIDGHEFDTGIIPVVKADEDVEPANQEHASDEKSSGSGWKSLMTNWKNRTQKED
ncbi:hypothetical protein [Schaalia vaccimaxillae]|uniref:hypothetical protein n=1 Tax=Schaalia vaccimaxillae TaxID=183916 RepID=UPI0003B3CAC8|nr:hypothetical protein [Schaalia vaccimaxillae]